MPKVFSEDKEKLYLLSFESLLSMLQHMDLEVDAQFIVERQTS